MCNVYICFMRNTRGGNVTKILSWWSVNEMKEVFQKLNNIPVETRREWGIKYRDYTFAVNVCNELLKRMEKESERVKSSTERSLKRKVEEYSKRLEGANAR
jgi:hypothetical protein